MADTVTNFGPAASSRPRLTARPETFAEQFLNSSVVWLALMAYWALSDVIIGIFPPGGRQVQPDGWLVHLGFTIAGLLAIAAMHRTGFPAAWDARFAARNRLLLPLLVGAAGGLLAIGIELYGGATKILAAKLGGAFNVDFPGSLLVYSAGAISMEALFLLIPLPILLWLISNVILRGRGQTQTFWALAVVSSAAEPLLQGGSLVLLAGGALPTPVVVMYAIESFAHNFASAYLFRRYGFLAAILVRLGHYMLWHVLFGNFCM